MSEPPAMPTTRDRQEARLRQHRIATLGPALYRAVLPTGQPWLDLTADERLRWGLAAEDIFQRGVEAGRE